MRVYFELRKDHKDKNGLCPLTLNYTHKGYRLRLDTEVSIPEKGYYRIIHKYTSQLVIDPSINGKIIKGKDIEIKFDYTELVQKLEKCETKLKSIIDGWRKLEERGVGEYPDPDYVKDFYKNKQVKGNEKPMILLLLEHIYGSLDPIRKEYVGGKKGDIRRWNTILGDVLEIRGHKIDFRKSKTEKIKNWRDVIEDILLKKDNNLINFYLKDVNKVFLDSYVDVLLKREYGGRKGLENTTIKKRIKTFKEFLNKMIEENHKVNLDFKKFKLEKETYKDLDLDTNIHILEIDEYKKLLELDLSDNPRLEYVKDLYLITCGTGLRFSDVIRIDSTMVKSKKVNKETMRYLKITTQKTGTEVSPPITDPIYNILKKYHMDMKRSYPGGIHTISNDKGNQYLREVLDKLNLDSLNDPDENKRKSQKITTTIKGKRKDFITFHSGRKFYITNCILSGIPINLIMGWTGHHGNWDVFENYIGTKYGENIHLNKLPF